MNKYQKSKSIARDYKSILIVRMDRLGDVVLSTPAIKAVRDTYPGSYIAVVVRPYARDIVEGNPYVNEVITYDNKGKEKGLLGNIKFISNLRKKKIDLAIILHPKNSSHLFTFLAGIPERLGYNKKLGFLLTRKIPDEKHYGLRHESDYTLDLLRYIGIARSEDITLYIPVKDESEAKIGGIFKRNGIKDGDLVAVLHPGASCSSKRWSPDRFAKVADALYDKYGAKIIIITGYGDRRFGDKVAGSMRAPSLNLSGNTTVADLASIFRRSKIFISNDSGPVHIACAVGTPTISIFGRNDRGLSPRRWGPIGNNNIVLYKDVGCEVCLAHNCKRGFKCLEAISVEDVLSAADRILR